MNGENADVGVGSARRALFTQRLQEANGGAVSDAVAMQCAVTGSLVTYASFRRGGFTMMPYAVGKVPRYSAVVFAGLFGYSFGRSFVMSQFGD